MYSQEFSQVVRSSRAEAIREKRVCTPILPSRDIRINLLRRYNICITNKWVKSLKLSGSLSFSVPDFITVACASVPLSDSVKNLGVILDCHLTMKTHVSNVVRSANF